MSSRHFDDLLELIGELGALSDILRVELRFLRVMIKWVNNRSGVSTRDSSWASTIENHVKNAYLDIQQPYKAGDHVQMTIIVLDLCTSIGMHKESIVSFCKFYIREGRQDVLLANGGVLIRDPVAEILDPLLDNMDPLVECTAAQPLKEQLQVLQGRLVFIRICLSMKTISADLYSGDLSGGVFYLVELICEHALFVCSLCWWAEDGNTDHLEVLVTDLLVEIQDTESYIRLQFSDDLHASGVEIQTAAGVDLQALGALEGLDADLIDWITSAPAEDILRAEMEHIKALSKEIPFLKYFLMENIQKEFCTELTQIKFCAQEVTSALLSISLSETRDEMFDKLNEMLCDLVKCIEITKSEIRQHFIPGNLSWHFPGTMHLGSVDFFLQNLDDLVRNRGHLIHTYAIDDTEALLSELLTLRSLVGDALAQQKNVEVKELKQIEQRVVAVSYKAEFLVDYIMCANGAKWRHMLLLSDVVDEIKLLNLEASQICDISMHLRELRLDNPEDEEDVVDSKSSESSFIARPSSIHYAIDDEEVVGFEDELEKMRDRLERGPRHLDIVSIVGMPGLGKTTLARKLYKIRSVTSCFHLRSWCCVSQAYTRRGLLLDILDDIIEPGQSFHGRNFGEMSDDDLAEVLYKSLKGRKYLIVLDDVWSVDAWRDLSLCFPNEGNGSRILLTSRSEDVCLQIKPNGSPVNLRLFSNGESWLLLQKKVSGGSIAPLEWSTNNKKLVESCGGLPLAVVLVAGILKTKLQFQWDEIEESMIKQTSDEHKRIMGVLELSYLHLPDHLKPCFLYFGIFPADKEISVQKLIALWIAEGMVPAIKGRNLEDVAEAYLKDLVGRSLVMVAKGKSKGGMKTCYIHGLLLQLCLEKAKEENFMLLSHGNEEIFTYWDASEDEAHYLPKDHQPERLCIHAERNGMEFWRPYNFPHARSLLFFATAPDEIIAEFPNDFSFLKHRTKLLRVLDLTQYKICKGFPYGVEFLAHLRYLSVRAAFAAVPPRIMNLWSLETFLVKGMRGEVSVPGNIWKLRKLRNLQIRDRADFKSVEDGVGYGDEFDNSFASFDIESLSTPTLRFGDDSILGTLGQLQCLRKLRCIFMESWDFTLGCNRFPVLDFLSKLESLKIFYHGKVQHPCGEFSFPLNLKKLTLSKFRLPWSQISEIGRLPNLEVLKLLFKSFEGDLWDVNDEEFMNLKFLELEALDIAQWDVSMCSDPFPRLEHLVVQRCKKLESIPSELGYVTTLQKIDVQFCSRAAAESAEAIQEEQLDMGNSDLQVHIHPSGTGFGPIPQALME